MNILEIKEEDISNAYYDQRTKQYSIAQIVEACADAPLGEFQRLCSRFKNAHTFVELTNLLVHNPVSDPSKRFSRVNTILMRGTDHIYDWSRMAR